MDLQRSHPVGILRRRRQCVGLVACTETIVPYHMYIEVVNEPAKIAPEVSELYDLLHSIVFTQVLI